VGELVGPGKHARVAVLGFAYLENSDDTRNSPSAELVHLLSKRGFDVAVHDPFVRQHKGDVMDVLRNADCAVLMVAHTLYREIDLNHAAALMRTRALVDARGFFETHALKEAGFNYRLIGVGRKAAAYSKAEEPK
jgi:UDP-N-acetyl-D-mannosaminuronic acid dehydrogenase